MQKKLTITIDEKVYKGLYRVVGRRRISQFIEGLVRDKVLTDELEQGYLAMSQDGDRESEAREWAETMIGDVRR